jgi:2'-5' RNA ligase
MGWLRSLDRPARPGVRWTTEAQWHVTLRFVGPVEADSAAALQGSLSEVAARCSPVTARAGPRPEVLQAGIWVLPVGGLEALAGAVEGATASVGRPPPTRAFRGHVTLARARRPGPGALRDLEAGEVDEAWEVPEITLVQSTLLPAGARYEVVGRWALGSGPA